MSIVARRILSILLKRNKNPRLYSTVSANGTKERIVSSSILGEQLASSTPPPEIAAVAGRVGGKPLSFLKYTVLAAFTGGVATAGYATYGMRLLVVAIFFAKCVVISYTFVTPNRMRNYTK